MTATQKTTKLQKISDKIKTAKTIAVFSHINHDPDALGSMSGLAHFLKRLKKDVDKYLDSKIEGADLKFFNAQDVKSELEAKNYDLLIMVDSPLASRLGKFCTFFKEHPNTVRIDHHPGLYKDAKVELTVPYTSASELVLELIEFMGHKPDKTEAKELYGGLLTDSDSFITDNTTMSSFQNAVKLLSYGADNIEAANMLFRSKSLNMFKLEGRAIEKYEVYDKDIAISSLTARDFKQAGLKDFTTEGIANKLLNVEGINISCLIKQQAHNTFSCSFRCTHGYNVAKIAARFGGGGHIQAAGCRNVKGSEKQVKELVLRAIRELR